MAEKLTVLMLTNLFKRIFRAPERHEQRAEPDEKAEAGPAETYRDPDFASFWHGPIDGITYGCLASFPHYGVRLRLYSYDESLRAPPGIEIADAREICADETLVERYIADGKIESAKFANLFRYLLLQKSNICWIDCDFLCLREPDFQHEASVFGRQFAAGDPWSINNAVLRLPPDSPALAELIDGARTVVDLDQHWGVIGPELVTSIIERAGLGEQARPISDFYALAPDQFWMPLLPEEKKRVEAEVSSSTLLHLWHNNFKRSGYDKNVAPPEGSFLYEAFVRVGGLGGFSRTYDVEELKNQIGEWLPAEKAWPNDYARAQINQIRGEIDHLRETTKFLMNVMSTEPEEADDHKVTSGRWKWGNGSVVSFGSNGIIGINERREGIWRRLINQPDAVIAIWDNGGWMDIVECEGEGTLKCRNNFGVTFVALQIME